MNMMMQANWKSRWAVSKADFAQQCQTEHQRFRECLAAPEETQQQVLEDLVRISKRSLLWREMGYEIATVDADSFRRQIPIRYYADFAPWIEQALVNKGGTLTCSPVLRWLKTSGTTGQSKKIPYTQHWLSRYRVPAMKAMWATYLRYCPQMLDHPCAVLDMQTVREEPVEYLKGLPWQSISNRHPLLDDSDWNPPWMDSPWYVAMRACKHEERMYQRVRHLVGQPLRFISTINPSTLVSMRDIITNQRQRLVEDIRQGTLNGERCFEPDAALAEQVDAILSNPDFSFVDLWPDLQLYSCWSSASARLYRSALNALLPGVPQVPFMTCGTEGVVTLPVDDDVISQPLAINQAFYEFVPVSIDLEARLKAGETVETLLFNQLEAGKEYQLIMSQCNGLCRMATGDIFRVEGFEGRVPRLNFVARAGIFHSFTGEKLTESHVTEAIVRVMRAHQLETGLYLCGPEWKTIPGYVLMLELPDYVQLSGAQLSAEIDQALQDINIEYASKRITGRISELEVIPVHHHALARYVERKRTANNAAQYKYKPFSQDISFVGEVLALEKQPMVYGGAA